MAPRSMRGRGVRAILVGSLLAIAAVSLNAHAAPGDVPAVTRSSVATGWSKDASLIAVEFTQFIKPTATGSLTRVSDTSNVAGQVVAADPSGAPARGIAFLAAAPLAQDGTQYEVSFTVENLEGSAPFTYTQRFKVDANRPNPPTVTSPKGLNAMVPGCVNPPGGAANLGCNIGTTVVTDPVTAFEGKAKDYTPPTGVLNAVSGVHKIELRFYSVEEQVITALLDGTPSDDAFRATIPQTCSASACQVEVSWAKAASEIEELTPGVWSMRAVAIDYAGNESGPSRSVTFMVQ